MPNTVRGLFGVVIRDIIQYSSSKKEIAVDGIHRREIGAVNKYKVYG